MVLVGGRGLGLEAGKLEATKKTKKRARRPQGRQSHHPGPGVLAGVRVHYYPGDRAGRGVRQPFVAQDY